MSSYKGACFCGAVEIEVTGEPALMAYCHCDSCRSWAASPVSAFTLWAPDAVKVVKGADKIGRFMKTENSGRQFCTECGGHLMTDHPSMGLVDISSATIPSLVFRPAIHVNYAETVLPMKDGLPKFRDLPAEAGGSGETLPE